MRKIEKFYSGMVKTSKWTVGGSLLCLMGVLTSCATLSPEECIVGNWDTIGYSDGVAGYDVDRLSRHGKACSKAGIAPDIKAWEKGRTKGLKKYCTENNAYQLGRRGQDLKDPCFGNAYTHRQNNFNRANLRGKQYYNAEKQLATEKRRLKTFIKQYKNFHNSDQAGVDAREAKHYMYTIKRAITETTWKIDQLEKKVARLRNQNNPY